MSRVCVARLPILFLLASVFIGCSGNHRGAQPPPAPNQDVNQLYTNFSADSTKIVDEGYPLGEDQSRGHSFAMSVSTPRLKQIYKLLKEYVRLGNQIYDRSGNNVSVLSDGGMFPSQYENGQAALEIVRHELSQRDGNFRDDEGGLPRFRTDYPRNSLYQPDQPPRSEGTPGAGAACNTKPLLNTMTYTHEQADAACQQRKIDCGATECHLNNVNGREMCTCRIETTTRSDSTRYN